MQSTPDICKHKGILTHWKDYPEGSVERAKSLGIEVWSTSKRLDTTLNLWQTELSVLQREKPWKALGLKSADEFVKAVVGKSTKEISKEITKRTQIQKLRKEHPEWTQQQIADEVGVDKAYVSRTLTKSPQKGNIVNVPSHINGKNQKTDFRKLPPELQAKVASKEMSLNAAAIAVGIRKYLSAEDAVLKAFSKATERLMVLRSIVNALTDSERQILKDWLSEE